MPTSNSILFAIIQSLAQSADHQGKMTFDNTGDHDHAVYHTFLLALENAENRHPLAGELIRDAALLDPDGIPERLYADIEPLELDQALAALKDYSLIQRIPDKNRFTIHRLIQVVVLDICEG